MEQPRLLDRLRAAVRARHYSRRTEEAYAGWVKRFIFFHNKRHPAAMGAEEVNAFLTALATDRNVSASTQGQALSALLFLYRHVLDDPLPWMDDLVRAQRPARLPVALTVDEARMILDRLDGVPLLVAQLLYGSGLRLLEALMLRVKDIDFSRGQISVRDPKGRRDRVTMLPRVVSEPLQAHLERVRAVHQEDLHRGFGAVWLPDALSAKFPAAEKEWSWQWAFPATSRWRDAATGIERRHHLHETVIQKAVRRAALASGIAKRVTCHTFRHTPPCYEAAIRRR